MPASADPPLDLGAIITALADRGVDFVVIGGVAVQAHGYVRATNDLDIVPNPELHNLSLLGEALADLGAVLARGRRRIDVTDPQLLRRAPLVPLLVSHGRVDLVNLDQLPGRPRGYDQLRDRALVTLVAGREIRVAGLDDLIRMKRAAGRDDDLRDIAALTRTDEELDQEAAQRDRSLELDPDALADTEPAGEEDRPE